MNDSLASKPEGFSRSDATTPQEPIGIADRLHLRPDPALGSTVALKEDEDPTAQTAWLERCWSRVSEWPGKP